MQAFFLSVALALSFLLSVGAADRYKIHHDTESAMEEMTNLFHSLFPLVPEHTHFFWKTNQLGAATVHRTMPPVMSAPDGGGRATGLFPWRLQIDFRKRGPDCMRKCITQGVLHPVQCHSLC
ncbi:unnamed protein product [Larinioides sclopetarius]|uniref:Uncharacterized protein n=1 Tax=Larinioides sclopetarius TaxID=280406 RepID=A0AAV2A9B5_9ARAC